MTKFCEVCIEEGKNTEAKYNARLAPKYGNTWKLVCEEHFKECSSFSKQILKPDYESFKIIIN